MSAHAEGVAVNSGTAALHTAAFAAGIGPGDEVIVPAITFAASSNCVLYMGGYPVFADVEPGTLNLDPADVAAKITPRTKAIVAGGLYRVALRSCCAPRPGKTPTV